MANMLFTTAWQKISLGVGIYLIHTLRRKSKLENKLDFYCLSNHLSIILPVMFFTLRHMAKTPPRLSVPGLCVGICSFLGHHAPNWLGKLRPGALRDLLHIRLDAGTGLCVWPELRHGHPVLLSRPPHRHHRLLICHDHLQGQVLGKGDFTLRRPHQKQPQP